MLAGCTFALQNSRRSPTRAALTSGTTFFEESRHKYSSRTSDGLGRGDRTKRNGNTGVRRYEASSPLQDPTGGCERHSETGSTERLIQPLGTLSLHYTMDRCPRDAPTGASNSIGDRIPVGTAGTDRSHDRQRLLTPSRPVQSRLRLVLLDDIGPE